MTRSRSAPVTAMRIFVSSSFVDMREERDLLARRVFPQLRERCESYGTVLEDVDLRWGIPSEEALRKLTLSSCLEEVERCAPFFLGILGERYGSTLEGRPTDFERWPWLRDHAKKSATELEILAGALNHPAGSRHAFFYLRDPEATAGRPADFWESDASRRAALEDLKARIRTSGYPVREAYSDAKQFCELVLSDLGGWIDEHLGRGALDEHQRELRGQEVFRAQLRRAYVQRQALSKELTEAVRRHRGVVVSGAPGSGKSSLLVDWAAADSRTTKSRPFPLFRTWLGRSRTAEVFSYHVGATARSTDWATVLVTLCRQISERLSIDVTLPETPAALRAWFPQFLVRASRTSPLVLVFDGVDHLADRDRGRELTWIPRSVPKRVRLVVSCGLETPLRALHERGWHEIRISALEESERRTFAQVHLKRSGKRLSPLHLAEISTSSSCGETTYLRLLIDELRLHGAHHTLAERLTRYLACRDVNELQTLALDRIETEFDVPGQRLVRKVLASLWSARTGLGERQLRELLGRGEGAMPSAEWAPLLANLSPHLIDRSGYLALRDPRIRETVQKRYLGRSSEREVVHQDLAEYFGRRAWNRHKAEELPWHLAKVGAWEGLRSVLADDKYLLLVWPAMREEVLDYWRRTETATGRGAETVYRAERPTETRRARGQWIRAAILRDLGRLDAAEAILEVLLAWARKQRESEILRPALALVGEILARTSRYEAALKAFEEEAALCRELDAVPALADCQGNQGIVLRKLGRKEAAARCFSEQAAHATRLEWPQLRGRAEGNLAIAMLEERRFREAEKYLRSQEDICRTCGDDEGLQQCLGHRGLCRILQGRHRKARPFLEEQLAICRRIGSAQGRQQALGYFAQVAFAEADYDRALERTDERRALCHEVRHHDGEALALVMEARILSDGLGRPGSARVEECLELARVLVERHDLRDVLEELMALESWLRRWLTEVVARS